MRTLGHYLRYLSFFHFQPLLGLCALADEIRGERKYRLHTTGYEAIEKHRLRGPAAYDGFSYMPSNYVLLERIFRELNRRGHNGNLVDIGCGKGRTLAVAAHF